MFNSPLRPVEGKEFVDLGKTVGNNQHVPKAIHEQRSCNHAEAERNFHQRLLQPRDNRHSARGQAFTSQWSLCSRLDVNVRLLPFRNMLQVVRQVFLGLILSMKIKKRLLLTLYLKNHSLFLSSLRFVNDFPRKISIIRRWWIDERNTRGYVRQNLVLPSRGTDFSSACNVENFFVAKYVFRFATFVSSITGAFFFSFVPHIWDQCRGFSFGHVTLWNILPHICVVGGKLSITPWER